MSPARVLHVFKYFRPRFTGEGIFVERLAPAFARLRPDVIHDVAVTVTPRPHSCPVPPDSLGTVHYLADSEAGISQTELIFWLARNAHRYAAVHYHTHVDRTFLGSVLLRLLGRRVLLSATLDDSMPGILKTYRPLFRPLVRLLAGAIGCFVAISTKLFKENNLMVPPAKSEVLPIGIAIPEQRPVLRNTCRQQLGLNKEAIMLICVGGICPRKDQMFLVEQMPALVRDFPEIRLVLVGPALDAQYKAELDAYIACHELQQYVDFTDFAEAPWRFYAAADIMVFASRQEGFGTVVIEAMAQGLPVIARHLPDVNDMFIEPGKSGFLFTRAEEFQRHVATLARAPALRTQMGAAGRAFVASHFDIRTVAARYLALYGFPTDGIPA